MILIIDFGSQYTRLIARRIRELGVYTRVVPPHATLQELHEAQGIVLSGGPESVTDEQSLNRAILECGLPILGICFGFHLLCRQYGGDIGTGTSAEFGSTQITHRHGLLFDGVDKHFTAWMSHQDVVTDPGDTLQVIASSESNHIAALELPGQRCFAVQFHPEVDHTHQGKKILSNFVLKICGAQPTWQTESIIQTKQDTLREQLGNDSVLLALSGGVDSSVVAALLHSVIGDRLHAVFVDTGLLRAKEVAQVTETFRRRFPIELQVIDASEQFLARLTGVTDPEDKRKRIGKLFIELFEQAATKHSNCTWLAQGTIYPDVIESSDPNTSTKSKVIKSHHNVGGLPSHMQLKLVEPLRDLFKDEVRQLGEQLGLPKNMVWRHPFPGPGLAVRILGEVRPQYLEILRHADEIFITMLRQHNLYHEVSQAFAVFVPVQTVGVKGDNRVYEHLIALRAVKTDDFMTATAAQLPSEFLHQVADAIVNQVAGVTRVCYDISSKPPATVEWE